MRLTAMTDYALRLLIYVGKQGNDRLCTIAEVAQAHDLSEAHLMKITHQLGLAGWIQTVRGKGGGMRLALPPDQINLGAVVRSIEPDFQIVECLGTDDHCRLTGGCRLTGVFNAALAAFLGELDACTLADVLPVGRTAWARVTGPAAGARGRAQP